MSAKRKRDTSQTSEVLKTSEVSKTAQVSDIQPAPYELPDGWTWTTVADVISDSQAGFASGKKDVPHGIKHLRMNNISAGCELNLDSVLTVPQDLAKPRHLLQVNDVLVCHTNSAKLVGKVALFNVTGTYAFSNHLTRLRVASDRIDARWLWHVMATLCRERYFENRCKQWVNQATIERGTLLAAPVPLPPLPEQRRIVAKIEQLFAESRTAREALERVPALLKRFRQSVLAAAFRGQLTERDSNDEPASALLERIRNERRAKSEADLRARGKDQGKAKHEESAPPDTSDLPELPDGWIWATIGDCTEWSQYGPRFPKERISNTGTPVIRTTDMDTRGRVNPLTVPRASIVDSVVRKYQLRPGDLLITRSGTIGKCTVFLGADEPCIPGAYLIQFRLLLEGIEPTYLLDFLLSHAGQTQLLAGTTAVTQSNINAPTIKRIVFPLAPLAEQRRIVARIEALFAQADAVERAVAIARQRADKIDQSILSRAFRGEL